MSNDNHRDGIDRRKVLRTAGAAVGGGLALGATGTAAASGGRSTGDCYVKEISNDGELIVTLVKVFGEMYLFKEAAKYRNAGDVSTQSDVRAYEATESGHPVEFQKIDSSITPSDIESEGSVEIQGVDITPENYLEGYDVDFKKISDSCGDILFDSHHALEIHLEGGGAFASIGVAGLTGCLCYAAGAVGSIPTAGVSGYLAAGACSAVTAAVDAAVDVDEIPDSAILSFNLWDQDENYWINTSPTVAVGLAPGYHKNWNETPKIGEVDRNVHLYPVP